MAPDKKGFPGLRKDCSSEVVGLTEDKDIKLVAE
jgi:hypothetical protein